MRIFGADKLTSRNIKVMLLPPALVVCGKVMFSVMSVFLFGGGGGPKSKV